LEATETAAKVADKVTDKPLSLADLMLRYGIISNTGKGE
jgi:hypothetical protein